MQVQTVAHNIGTSSRFLEKLNPRGLNRPVIDKQPLFCATENVTNFLESLKNFGLTLVLLFALLFVECRRSNICFRDADIFPANEILEKRDINGLVSTLKKLHDQAF